MDQDKKNNFIFRINFPMVHLVKTEPAPIVMEMLQPLMLKIQDF